MNYKREPRSVEFSIKPGFCLTQPPPQKGPSPNNQSLACSQHLPIRPFPATSANRAFNGQENTSWVSVPPDLLTLNPSW